MKKAISSLALIILMSVTINIDAQASVIRGKKYYIQYFKTPCGFKGDVMGNYHTKKEWRNAYKDGTFIHLIKKICPNATVVLSKKKQKHLYHFLSSFASDSGNVPSCN